MPYYFECQICNDRVEVDAFNMDKERNCEDCGIDGCDNCIEGERCWDCTDKYWEELDNDAESS